MIEFPEHIRPSTANIKIISNSASFESVFTGASQTAQYPGSKLSMSLGFKDLTIEKAELLYAFVAEMDGFAGRTLLGDFTSLPTVTLGTPLVASVITAKNRIETKGWQPNSVILKRGRYLSFNNEMKVCVKQDAVSDANGNATIYLGPLIRNIPAVNTPIEVTNPKGIFRLADTENGKDVETFYKQSFTINFIEVVY